MHAPTLSRQAQIAGSSLHAAQSTAAGTNQHNPPADRYGSLTATHTRSHGNLNAHYCTQCARFNQKILKTKER